MKEYLTVKAWGEASFEEKRSRFIAHVMPVHTAEEAAAFVEAMKREYWDARHNVWAYVLADGTKRFSDDGEPQGTAGMPTLDVLEKQGVVDVCVVTTRYFGGILLGAGGLVRAYSHSAAMGLEAAEVVKMVPCVTATLTTDYPFYGRVPSLLAQWSAEALDTAFEENVTLHLEVPKCFLGGLSADVTEYSSGTFTVEVTGETYRPVPVE